VWEEKIYSFEYISKIFRTGNAIYITLVVAQSTGVWYDYDVYVVMSQCAK
jgi:hypothetical protein